MKVASCFCEESFDGSELETQVVQAIDHFSESHADLGLTETSIRNYVESIHRIDGAVDRLDEIGEIEILPVGAATRADIIEFFDRRAFADHPGWGMCYCMYHHVAGTYEGEWSRLTWQENRAAMSERIDAGATTGVVAYVDGVLAGFCNATSRAEFPARKMSDEPIGSIVCFVVAPPYRRHGVQRALLAGALSRLGELGFSEAEAYPVREPTGDASAFVGTLSLYEAAGFSIVGEEPLVVRKQLV